VLVGVTGGPNTGIKVGEGDYNPGGSLAESLAMWVVGELGVGLFRSKLRGFVRCPGNQWAFVD